MWRSDPIKYAAALILATGCLSSAAPLSRPAPDFPKTRTPIATQPALIPPNKKQASPPAISKAYETIIKRNLFAPLPKTAGPLIFEGVFPLADPEPLDKQINLLGIVISTEPGKEKKYAIIEDSRSKDADFYKPGAVIRGYALKDITEKGPIFETFIGTKFILTQTGARYLDQQIQTTYFKINIRDAVKQLEQDLPKMNGFIASPSADGLVLDNIPPGTILDKAGWADKDIVRTIAKTPVHSAMDIRTAYETVLKTGTKTLIVGLLRNNIPIRIVYMLE